jgi:hypothetical protein
MNYFNLISKKNVIVLLKSTMPKRSTKLKKYNQGSRRASNFESQSNFYTNRKSDFHVTTTLSEFENFLLCERILINVTTCQNETSN